LDERFSDTGERFDENIIAITDGPDNTIKAAKIGKTYIIADHDINQILGKELGAEGKKQIDAVFDVVSGNG